MYNAAAFTEAIPRREFLPTDLVGASGKQPWNPFESQRPGCSGRFTATGCSPPHDGYLTTFSQTPSPLMQRFLGMIEFISWNQTQLHARKPDRSCRGATHHGHTGRRDQRENTAPCGTPSPVQPCGHDCLAKLNPGLPSSPRNASSIVSAPLFSSSLSKYIR
jgi:hypothetical protein